jgi:rare lipoprotein A
VRGCLGALLFATAGLALAGCAAPAEEGWETAAYPPSGSIEPPVTQGAPAYEQGRASFYADRLAGHATASGEPYDPGAFTAAHPRLPFGSVVDVARPDGRHVRVRINDRGPHARGRIIDLSRRAAAELGMVREGVAEVVVRVIWKPPVRVGQR